MTNLESSPLSIEAPAGEALDNFHESFDARVWAKAFVRQMKFTPEIATDESTMLGWFANAIMRGYDEAANRQREQQSLLPPTGDGLDLEGTLTQFAKLFAFAHRAFLLLDNLSDDEECVRDHHGNCQTHGLERACSNAAARVLLDDNSEFLDKIEAALPMLTEAPKPLAVNGVDVEATLIEMERTVASHMSRCGQWGEDTVDDMPELQSQFATLRSALLARQRDGTPAGLPRGESAARDEICDALAEAITWLGELGDAANESTTLDIRRDRHIGEDDGSLTVRGLLRLLTQNEHAERHRTDLDELMERTWQRVARALSSASRPSTPLAAPEGSTGEDRQVACPDCCGEGREATGQVSREMAQDAGDLSLTGEMLYERCQRCHGDGWIIEGADAAKET